VFTKDLLTVCLSATCFTTRIPSYDFVPVQYEDSVDWTGFAARMAPTLLLIGLWLVMMRGMSGGMGGMGGMGGKGGECAV